MDDGFALSFSVPVAVGGWSHGDFYYQVKKQVLAGFRLSVDLGDKGTGWRTGSYLMYMKGKPSFVDPDQPDTLTEFTMEKVAFGIAFNYGGNLLPWFWLGMAGRYGFSFNLRKYPEGAEHYDGFLFGLVLSLGLEARFRVWDGPVDLGGLVSVTYDVEWIMPVRAIQRVLLNFGVIGEFGR